MDNRHSINNMADTIFMICILMLVTYFVIVVKEQANYDAMKVEPMAKIKYREVCLDQYMYYEIKSNNIDDEVITYKVMTNKEYKPIKCK